MVMLFLLGKDRKTEHNTHFCMPLEPVFTRDCGSGVHFTDEPTGNLDKDTGEQVMTCLIHAVKEEGATLVMVTHNEKLSSYADRVIRMENGKEIDS